MTSACGEAIWTAAEGIGGLATGVERCSLTISGVYSTSENIFFVWRDCSKIKFVYKLNYEIKKSLSVRFKRWTELEKESNSPGGASMPTIVWTFSSFVSVNCSFRFSASPRCRLDDDFSLEWRRWRLELSFEPLLWRWWSDERLSDECLSEECRSDEGFSDECLSEECRSDERFSDFSDGCLSEERRSDEAFSDECLSDECRSEDRLSDECLSDECFSDECLSDECRCFDDEDFLSLEDDEVCRLLWWDLLSLLLDLSLSSLSLLVFLRSSFSRFCLSIFLSKKSFNVFLPVQTSQRLSKTDSWCPCWKKLIPIRQISPWLKFIFWPFLIQLTLFHIL